MLYSYLSWTILKHYLDDFICLFPVKVATKKQLTKDNKAYCLLTNYSGVPRQDAKDIHNILVIVFGMKFDTKLFIVQVLTKKLVRVF